MSVFGVFLVLIFPHLDWICTRKTPNRDFFNAVEPSLEEVVAMNCFIQKLFLKILQMHKATITLESLIKKVVHWRHATLFKKEAPAQVLSSVFWKNFTDDSQDCRGREGTIFIPLYHFHPLTNIQTFICNLACEIAVDTGCKLGIHKTFKSCIWSSHVRSIYALCLRGWLSHRI